MIEDSLARHPSYVALRGTPGVRLLTTGEIARASGSVAIFWPGAAPFEFGDVPNVPASSAH